MTRPASSRSLPAPWVEGASRARLDELGAAMPSEPRDALAQLTQSLAAHVSQYDETGLPLYAGTNALSALVRSLHLPELSSRPSMGWPGAKYQTGMEHVEQVEVLTADLVARAMRANHAEVRFHSATMANL